MGGVSGAWRGWIWRIQAVPSHRPRAARLRAYVPLPFCVERCGYCSFNTAPYTPGGQDRFLSALLAEWDLLHAAPWAGGVRLDTLFLGGGTPSLLTVDQMAALLDRIGARLAVEPGAEVTVESNPDDLTSDRVAGYRRPAHPRVCPLPPPPSPPLPP